MLNKPGCFTFGIGLGQNDILLIIAIQDEKDVIDSRYP